MTTTFKIEERKPVWIALSNFYLDVELLDEDFRQIAETILKSPFSLEEVKQINKYEVFPVLQSNLLNVAGAWAGFNEEPLIEAITASLNNRNAVQTFIIECYYAFFKWRCSDYWRKLEEVYVELRGTEFK